MRSVNRMENTAFQNNDVIHTDQSFTGQNIIATEETEKPNRNQHVTLSTAFEIAIEAADNTDWTPEVNVKCGFMKGMLSDLKRRIPHYWSDYKDGVADRKSIQKSISCSFFLYFACILPCIAFGVLNSDNTRGVLTVEKVMYSQVFGGLVFAVFGGTPHIVLLITAPLAFYTNIIFSLSVEYELNFQAFFGCIGLFNCMFLVIFSILDLSKLMQFSRSVVKVRETRITSIFSHTLIGLSLLILSILAYIPTPVLYGLFLYVAITSLFGNQIFERIQLFFTEKATYPPRPYIGTVPHKKLHMFTGLQLVQLAVLCIVGFTPYPYLKMFFPVFIFFLIPIRHKLIPKVIEQKYLQALDGL